MAKFCTKCGAPLPDGSKFCAKCGTKVDEPMPSASKQQPKPHEPLGVPKSPAGVNRTPIIISVVVGVAVIASVIWLALNRTSSESNEDSVYIPVVEVDSSYDSIVAMEEPVVAVQDTIETNVVEELVEPEKPQSAPSYASGKFHGDFNGYPITVWLNTDANGNVTGRYCYDRVIEKYGDSPKAYFTLKGRFTDEYDAGHSWSLTSYQHGSSKPFEKIELSREGDDFGGTAVNYKSDRHGTYYINLYE